MLVGASNRARLVSDLLFAPGHLWGESSGGREEGCQGEVLVWQATLSAPRSGVLLVLLQTSFAEKA